MENDNVRNAFQLTFGAKYPEWFIVNVDNQPKLTNEELWYFKLELVEKYFKVHNKLPSKTTKNTDNDARLLGGWLSSQQQNHKNGEQIMKNPSIRNAYELFRAKYYKRIVNTSNEDIWNDNLQLTEKYIAIHGILPPRTNKDESITRLNRWLNHQHNNYINKEYNMKDPIILAAYESFLTKHFNIINI